MVTLCPVPACLIETLVNVALPSLPTAPVRANLIERMVIEAMVNKVMVIRI